MRSERGRKVLGLVVILTSAVMLFSFISHFFTGYKDQAGEGLPANWLGGVGAWLSELFVRKGFGALAVVIPLYTGLWGFAILEKKYSPFLFKILKYVFFSVIWGSIFLAFCSYLIWNKPSLLGGGFGWYMNELLMYPIGRIGTGLVVVVSFLVFLVVNFNVDLPFSKLLPKKPGEVDAEVGAEGDRGPEDVNRDMFRQKIRFWRRRRRRKKATNSKSPCGRSLRRSPMKLW